MAAKTPYAETVDQFLRWLRAEAKDMRYADFTDAAEQLEELCAMVPTNIRELAATDDTEMGAERAVIHLEKWLIGQALHAYWGQHDQERATRIQWVANAVRSRSFRQERGAR